MLVLSVLNKKNGGGAVGLKRNRSRRKHANEVHGLNTTPSWVISILLILQWGLGFGLGDMVLTNPSYPRAPETMKKDTMPRARLPTAERPRQCWGHIPTGSFLSSPYFTSFR